MKYIVTGATSFIGLELTNYLIERKHSVIAVCRPGSNGLSFLPEGVDIVTSEMHDYGCLHEKVSDADVFINLAWAGTGHGGRNISAVQNDNISFTTAAMYSARKIGCKLFVEAGSQAEYGSTSEPQSENSPCNPFSEYGKAKLRVKNDLFKLSEELGIKYIHLRIFSIFGENDHPWTLVMSALDKMHGNERIELSPCTQNWNFLYSKDAVRIIMELCGNAVQDPLFRHEVYNVASDDTRILKDFVERMKQLANSTSELVYGAITPQNFVSLQPDMSKTKSVVGILNEYSFDQVIRTIMQKRYSID